MTVIVIAVFYNRGNLMKKLLVLFLLLIFSNCAFAVNSYDKYGNKTGSYRTDSNGRTTQYDKYGRKVGSYICYLNCYHIH